ncbi:kinase-like domain-containing protein [Hyaloscypha sp. PMI_1271]|nr:kinase-like domain-containing protein [Hyaloscypha sp. PMI_1271]
MATHKSNKEMTLYSELGKKITCVITEKEYIPSQRIQDKITVQRVEAKIKAHWSWKSCRDRKLDEYVASAKKIIAILVRIEKDNRDSIKQAMAIGLEDRHLPLERVGNLLKCRDSDQTFQFEGWTEVSLDNFERDQYLVMAPVVKLDGVNVVDITVNEGCGLDFATCEPYGESTLFSQIFKAELRPEPNVRATDVAATPTVVAVKKFLGNRDTARANYRKELKNLNRIQELNNQHLIKHVAICNEIPFIIFPWANGNELKVFWQSNSTNERTSELFLWAMEQLCGLADGLSALHGKSMNCRHGDLKPSNILHFTEGGSPRGLLKIADLGVSQIHDDPTVLRIVATTTTASTEVYKGPEAYILEKSLKPRSRTYDCWSMGCIILEFVIWLLYDFAALENFEKRRDGPRGSHCYYSRKPSCSEEEVTECWQMTKRHDNVDEAIKCLRDDGRCKGSAMGKLVDLVDEKLLQVNPEARFYGGLLHLGIREILDECKSSKTPLVNSGPRPELPVVFTEPPEWSLSQTTTAESKVSSSSVWTGNKASYGVSISCEERDSAVVMVSVDQE